jgi:flagellar FliL protein
VKGIIRIAVTALLQIALAWALVFYVVGPKMRGEPFFWQEAPAAEGEEEAAEVHELGALLPMDGILVNVADTKGRRFFKTSLTLEMEGKDLEAEAPERMPVLRGKVIDVLSRKTMEQLVQPGARDSLRTELLATLNAEVTGGEFRDVFFTEFLVQ